MARLSLFCILLVIVLAYLERTDAGSRIARSPQYRRYGPPLPPAPPPRGFGPGYDPYGYSGRFDRGPGRFDRGPGRFDRGPSHHGHGHHDRDKYDIPPGGSISISKTISISSGGNAQSSASSSAGSGGFNTGPGGSSAGSGGFNAGPSGSSASSNAESSASGK